MRANRKVDSKPEVQLRRVLHMRGLRFRKNLLIRTSSVKVKPDIVFTAKRVAIFVDGCFWHRCPHHGTEPRSNAGYWSRKLARNIERDLEVTDALEADGWTVVRVWEHDDPSAVAEFVIPLVQNSERPA